MLKNKRADTANSASWAAVKTKMQVETSVLSFCFSLSVTRSPHVVSYMQNQMDKKKAGYAEALKAILWRVIPAKSCSLIRTELQGCCGGRFQAVLLPPQFLSVYFCH